jgi:hypothetical protein
MSLFLYGFVQDKDPQLLCAQDRAAFNASEPFNPTPANDDMGAPPSLPLSLPRQRPQAVQRAAAAASRGRGCWHLAMLPCSAAQHGAPGGACPHAHPICVCCTVSRVQAR